MHYVYLIAERGQASLMKSQRVTENSYDCSRESIHFVWPNVFLVVFGLSYVLYILYRHSYLANKFALLWFFFCSSGIGFRLSSLTRIFFQLFKCKSIEKHHKHTNDHMLTISRDMNPHPNFQDVHTCRIMIYLPQEERGERCADLDRIIQTGPKGDFYQCYLKYFKNFALRSHNWPPEFWTNIFRQLIDLVFQVSQSLFQAKNSCLVTLANIYLALDGKNVFYWVSQMNFNDVKPFGTFD